MMSSLDPKNAKVSIVGLGYVGMPLALALADYFPTTGFDVNTARITELKSGHDRNLEIESGRLLRTSCTFTANEKDLAQSNVFIVTVPTPITDSNDPDLYLVEKASETVSRYLKKGDVVVYESTVYPGVTEDICGAVLERGSGLKAGVDFWLGYSPERINPGDTEHTVNKITKVVAGQNPEVTDYLAVIYGKTNGGNIFRAHDIKTAEASKVIENAQRDINIAFINEVTQVMNSLNLSVYDVLEAASTKWNFLPFKPGLVGGHCIGVDPYYLSHCAQNLGHDPQVILAGRRTNDTMGAYFAHRLMNALPKAGRKVLLLGFTFKENINDIRNTKVMDVYQTLIDEGCTVDIYDPHASLDEVKDHYGVDLLPQSPESGDYDAAVLAVAHEVFRGLEPKALKKIVKNGGLIYDLRGIWRNQDFSDGLRYLTV
jgi:UDP-N-acetyl-D-galactosamine dehydrogenase